MGADEVGSTGGIEVRVREFLEGILIERLPRLLRIGMDRMRIEMEDAIRVVH